MEIVVPVNATAATLRRDGMPVASVNRKAKELLDNGKIAARLLQLRATHAECHAAAVDEIARKLREDREFARQYAKPSACVAATMGLAKLYGHLTDKTEITGKGGADFINTRKEEEERNMLADRLREAFDRFTEAQSKQSSVQ